MTTPSAAGSTPLGSTARELWVVWLGLGVLGVGFGVVVTGLGLPWWLAPLTSGVVFAGSVEFVLVGMIAAAAPVSAIAATTFLVNSRHLFYGLSFPVQRIPRRLGRAYSVFALCDEAYALATGPRGAHRTGAHLLWMQLGLHLSWVLGSLLGAVAGATVLAGLHGLEFVMTALFVMLAIDGLRDSPDAIAALTAAVCGVGALLIVPGSMLLAALTAFATAMAVRSRVGRSAGR